MNHTLESPNKASVRHLWSRFVVFCFLILLAMVVFKIHSPWFGFILTMVGTAIIIFQNRPIIWREGDTWTISGKHWVSLKHIVSELKNCGMAEVPSRKDLLVFRPQSSPLLPVS